MDQPISEYRQRRTVVAVGASAGGVRALSALVSGLSPDFPLPVAIVLHLPSGARSALADILDRAGPLSARPAINGEVAEPGRIYVAVPAQHLVFEGGKFFLTDGPTESGHRPAINALFRSVAVSAGASAIGVLLSGVLDDGVSGLGSIRSRGGISIVQDPADALYPAMPQNALAAGAVDHVRAAGEIGVLLSKLAHEEVGSIVPQLDPHLEVENRIAMGSRFTAPVNPDHLGFPSGFTCPDCAGSLVKVAKDGYRCRVGHAWTPDALLRAKDSDVERALWIALRTLDEKGKLSSTLADRNLTASPGFRSRYAAAAQEAKHAAQVIREHLAMLYEAQRMAGDEDEQYG